MRLRRIYLIIARCAIAPSRVDVPVIFDGQEGGPVVENEVRSRTTSILSVGWIWQCWRAAMRRSRFSPFPFLAEDTVVMTAATQPPRAASDPPIRAANPLLTGPILPTLLRLALPNLVSLVFLTAVVIAETSYIGRLGTEPLAAMALVFPMIMLTQQMSSGAMGGGVSSAVARAIGAGDEARARALACTRSSSAPAAACCSWRCC